MSLKETLRAKLTEARKAGNAEVKNLISVVLGDVATAEARAAIDDLPDAEVEKLVRKLIVSNEESRKQLEAHGRADDPQVAVLTREIAFLKSVLPASLDAAAILQALEPVRATIVQAKNDGQATGVAMKHLKQQKLNVLGEDVAQVVKQMRSA